MNATQTATQDRPTQDDATQGQPADAYAGYDEWLASLPEQLPTPEDFGPTPERVTEILAECGGDPFAD